MSTSSYRSQRDNKRKSRLNAEKKAGEHRAKELKKRAEAAKARAAADKASSATGQSSKLRTAARLEGEAEKAGKSAVDWNKKATHYGVQEADLDAKMTKAQQREDLVAEKNSQKAQ